MGRQPVEDHHLGSAWGWNPEDRHDIPSFDQSAAQRMFGLKSHDGDDVGFVLDGMFEVVHDTPSFAHAGRGDDHTGALQFIQSFAFFRRGNIANISGRKGISFRRERAEGFFVVTLGVFSKDVCDLRRQRRVDINRERVDSPLSHQSFDPHDQVLRASERECGHDDLALLFFGMGDQLLSFLSQRLPGFFVQAVAVGGFDDQHITAWRRSGIAEDRHLRAPEIARKEHRRTIAARGIFEANGGGSKDMADVVEGRGDAWGHLNRVVIAGADEATDNGAGVAAFVKGLEAALPAPLFLPIQIGAVVFLQAGRIFQHHGSKIGGRTSHVHRPAKLMFAQYGQGSGMVDVGM